MKLMEQIKARFARSNIEIVNNARLTYDLCLHGVITRTNAIDQLTKKHLQTHEPYIKDNIARKIQDLNMRIGLRRPD